MVEEEQEVFDEIMADGGAALAEASMRNLVLNVHGENVGGNSEGLNMFDVVYEDVLDDEEDDDEFVDLFLSSGPLVA